jgi:copper chaperone CopZ
MTTDNIQILNLSCRGCVNTITRNLKALDGVENC